MKRLFFLLLLAGPILFAGCSALRSTPSDASPAVAENPAEATAPADREVGDSSFRPQDSRYGVGTGLSDQARDIERSLGYK